MNTPNDPATFVDDIKHLIFDQNAFRSVIILILALLLAYWLSRFVAQGIVKIAQHIATRSDNESDYDRQTKLRQTETYLSITIAIVRFVVVIVVGYLAWKFLSPFSRNTGINGIAAIGAGTFFALVAGQTLGIVLRDITAGTLMISEGWYKIGDFITIEPYNNIEGVVERFTLRSTKIRKLNGDTVWVHNQRIAAAHVAPKGVRTLSVDVFVRDREKGEAAIRKIISAIPKGKTMLAKPLRITQTEEWGENRWRITVKGQTPPGREWLINDFFVQACIDLDDGKVGSEKLLALPPMPHSTDEVAERQFRRAVRVKQDEEKEK